MPTIRPRSPSPSEGARSSKRQKLNEADDTSAFVPDLFEQATVKKLADAYEASEPYKHAVLDRLVDDDLLKKVKDEILGELRFAEKETDIYKVHQTGDLASLNYLTPEQLTLFPSLLRLRNALYSTPFRRFVRGVTGCGPLSGTQQDMSSNSYRQGCHLLNHDDVIGTRRVSYILYLPLSGSGSTDWKDEWGGALELYPVLPPVEGQLPEPDTKPSKRVPPAWNQFVFFEVQPGHSFHSVEEVVVALGEDKEGRQRLSVSGWFHMAKPGEEGYEEDRERDRTERLASSLEQLSASPPIALKPYPSPLPIFIPSTPFTESELIFLSSYLNPVYLQPRSLTLLSQQFTKDSSLSLKDILSEALAEKLDAALRQKDAADCLGPDRQCRIPAHSAGEGNGWVLAGPPHKLRYCVLDPSAALPPAKTIDGETASATTLLRSLQDDLLPSPAFRAWLGLVTSLVPLNHNVIARRFRPGLDYTLAQADEEEARLDVTLSLTPQPHPKAKPAQTKVDKKGKGKTVEKETEEEEMGGWESCAWGGWESYMAPHEGEEDPAVYRSSGGSRSKGVNGTSERANGQDHAGKEEVKEPQDKLLEDGDIDAPEEGDEEQAEDEEDEEGFEIAEEDREAYEEALAMEAADRAANGDGPAENGEEGEDAEEDYEDETGTLLTQPASFNGLLIVLRDPKLMYFVKYVSAAAEGSRWDVCGEWQIGELEEDDGEEQAGES
ncbi:hypothetical protein DACRYDRAFT_97845 [Dacryopinax primogenitus]|uniref:uS12 prolyl 3,4-dihydroxylase n=1 Tax=Dacryopinax primogenitus (strain DJM 731) TaxID=1858805 RepID=M5GH00_DACPD|nr:uncharacterized protein DACRYDRAFT_97845 [Dacryopinax primogenitus]EJU06373.1 hypothetical protein DACRYDRAFT_97845 [Dacryopinax primogenitus]